MAYDLLAITNVNRVWDRALNGTICVLESGMDEFLTLAEVNQEFDSEWVLLGDTEVGEHDEIIRGRVVFHSKDRDEVYSKLLELRPNKAATYYSGARSRDKVYVL